jgi:hypothetical protein
VAEIIAALVMGLLLVQKRIFSYEPPGRDCAWLFEPVFEVVFEIVIDEAKYVR